MSKAVRWQVPFVSVSGTKYRVDIYDDTGSWSGVTQLLPGDQPFVTDEDASDDYFAPVRSQSGTLQVCTKIEPQTTYPSGGTLSLNDILPANNIAHPVRLVSIAANNAETIEWQGFLSCEAYNQDYVGIPQNLSLSLISVLEAMDSVEIKPNTNMAFKTIMGHVAYALQAIVNDCGISDLINQVFISAYCRTAMTTQYIYNNAYFEQNEIVSGDNITVEVHSLSCKQILEQVAKLFGACWREKGQNIYMAVIGKNNAFNYHSLTAIYNRYVTGGSSITWLSAQQVTADLSAQTWMGTGHQLSALQGMRRVMVKSNLKDFECEIRLNETPVNSLVENPESRQSTWGEVHVNTNETFYSHAEHRHMRVKAVFPTDLSGASLQFVSNLSAINYGSTIFWANNEFRTYYYDLVNVQTKGSNDGIQCTCTSFMAWWRDGDGNLQSGLMICGVPKYLIYTDLGQGRAWSKFALTASNYLFKQTTPLNFATSKGFLKIDLRTLAFAGVQKMNQILYGNVYPYVTVALQFGDLWAFQSGSSYGWDTSFHTIDLPLDRTTGTGEHKLISNWDESMGVKEEDGIYIPIHNPKTGPVTIYLYHEIYACCADPYWHCMFDMFINKLDVDYVPLEEELKTDRSDNAYVKETSKNFRDTLDLSLDLASDANNLKQASLLWNNATTPAKLITLNGQSIRPEVDLLNRLAAYYGAARQRLELEVAHPTAAPLPLLKLNGINDCKVYLPLSESRDWQTGVCKLTCFETPT